MDFKNKVLIIGYGAVCKCMSPDGASPDVNIPLENITIIDFKDKSKDLKAWTTRGLRFFKKKITPGNLAQTLDEHLAEGGLLIDVGMEHRLLRGSCQWCHDHKRPVREHLRRGSGIPMPRPYRRAPTRRPCTTGQMRLMELTRDWKDAPTCVVDHGANPGLISHFAKHGLVDIAREDDRRRDRKGSHR